MGDAAQVGAINTRRQRRQLCVRYHKVKWLVLVCSLAAVLIGFGQRGRGALILERASDGSPIYPLSSGSSDGALLAVGLISFFFPVFASLVAVLSKGDSRSQQFAYWFSFSFLGLVVFLVELDSSLLSAASLGDTWPLVGVTVAAIPGAALVTKHLTTHSRRMLNGVA